MELLAQRPRSNCSHVSVIPVKVLLVFSKFPRPPDANLSPLRPSFDTLRRFPPSMLTTDHFSLFGQAALYIFPCVSDDYGDRNIPTGLHSFLGTVLCFFVFSWPANLRFGCFRYGGNSPPCELCTNNRSLDRGHLTSECRCEVDAREPASLIVYHLDGVYTEGGSPLPR